MAPFLWSRLEMTARHVLERHQWVPLPVHEVFDFFSRADNLSRITPGWMGFTVTSPAPLVMEAGTRIDYRIRLGPFPMGWRTLIAEWEPGRAFVDVQERGPYREWIHRHEFQPSGEGTVVRDRVEYRLPAGVLGRAVHALGVRATLNAIFDFRFSAIERAFAARTITGSHGTVSLVTSDCPDERF